jgi:RNA-directed DNA polymerase
MRGWANYYRHGVAKAIFSRVDHLIFQALMRWIKRRHPKKNAQWQCKKYFRTQGMRKWIFSISVKNKKKEKIFLDLFTLLDLPIRRHVKIRSEANLYDPQYADYFLKRERLKIKQRTRDWEILNALQNKPWDSRVI